MKNLIIIAIATITLSTACGSNRHVRRSDDPAAKSERLERAVMAIGAENLPNQDGHYSITLTRSQARKMGVKGRDYRLVIDRIEQVNKEVDEMKRQAEEYNKFLRDSVQNRIEH